MRRVLPNLGVAVLATLVGFALLEAGIRALHLIPDDDPVRYRSVPGDEGYAVLPGQSRRSLLGIRYRTDDLGLRGPGHDLQDPRRRVVLLGDSVVWGYGVSWEDTIGERLEALTTAAGRELAVWNLGMTANAPVHEAARFERLAGTVRPGVTVLVSLLNDVGADPRHYRISATGPVSPSSAVAARSSSSISPTPWACPPGPNSSCPQTRHTPTRLVPN